ncbi:MAG: hypothetical protein WDW36_005228 [Sanguina aurantia]
MVGAAAAFVDTEGRFYKALQDGARGGRELALYERVWGMKDTQGAVLPLVHTDSGHGTVQQGGPPGTASGSHQSAISSPDEALHLRRFIPAYFGSLEQNGQQLLILSDVCHGMSKPCVIDIKVRKTLASSPRPGLRSDLLMDMMGLSTAYDWADPSSTRKNRLKDASTTQSSMGFRVCGYRVYRPATGDYVVVGKEHGRRLTPDTMQAALAHFAAAGSSTPATVFRSALPQLRQLETWFSTQTSLQFFASSVLIVYDGDVTHSQEGTTSSSMHQQVRVQMIDFAHSFPITSGHLDTNVLTGIRTLIQTLEHISGQ